MQYAVLTTKHHEGFTLWDSAVSDHTVAHTPHGADLVVPSWRPSAPRVSGSAYHSLIDWHHPDSTIDSVHPQRDLPAAEIERLNARRVLTLTRWPPPGWGRRGRAAPPSAARSTAEAAPGR